MAPDSGTEPALVPWMGPRLLTLFAGSMGWVGPRVSLTQRETGWWGRQESKGWSPQVIAWCMVHHPGTQAQRPCHHHQDELKKQPLLPGQLGLKQDGRAWYEWDAS